MRQPLSDGELHRVVVKVADLRRVAGVLVEDTSLLDQIDRALAELKDLRRVRVEKRA